jgi:protein-disulfide isomerase
MVFLWLPMKRYLPYLIVGFVAIATFGSGFALYRVKRVAPSGVPKNGPPSGMHVRGKASAAVTIEEFGDFQCPPCGMMATALKKAEEDYGDKLRVIFHHFPLAVHAHAREAALYVEAAANQNRFWEMHDVIYKEQVIWSKAADVPALFNGYATSLGLDLERLKKDLASPEVAARVEADQKLGASRDVTATPTLFVNNVAMPADETNPIGLKKAIDTALKQKEKPQR